MWVFLSRSGWGIILGGWRWVGVYKALFWVGRGECGSVRHYFGWVGVGGKIFWVGGGGWGLVGAGDSGCSV